MRKNVLITSDEKWGMALGGRARRWAIAFSFGIFLLADIAHAPAAEEDALKLLGRDLQPVSEINLELAPGTTTVERTYYLRQPDPEADPLEDVNLSLALTSGATELLLPSGSSATDTFDVPGDSGTVPITIRVNVAADTEATGTLLAFVEDRGQVLAEVSASAPSAPSVKVLEAADGSISRTSPTADYTLFLTLRGGQQGASDLRVEVPPLRHTSDRQFPADVSIVGGGSVTLGSNETARVAVTVDLPIAGEYKGDVIVIHDDKEQPPIPLTITRTQTAPSVEILAVTRTRSVANPVVPDQLVFEVLIRETSGVSVVLNRPLLVATGRKEGEGRSGPSFQSDDVTIESVDPESGEADPVGQELEVAANENVVLRFTIDAMDTPGEYGGTLLLAAPGSELVTADTTFLVRRPAWLAFILIFLGVAGGFFVREILLKRGARARQRIHIVELDEELARVRGRIDPTDTEGIKAGSVLKARIDTLYGNPDEETDATLTTKVQTLSLQIALLDHGLVLGKKLRDLRPPERGDPFRLVLEAAYGAILSPTRSKEDLATELTSVKTALSELEKILRGQIGEDIDKLEAEAEATLQQAGFLRREESRQMVKDQVVPLLIGAKKTLDKATRDSLVTALRQVDEATELYVNALLQDLADRISGSPPTGITDAEWRDLQLKVRAAITGNTQSDRHRAYKAAVGVYLQGLATATGRRAQEKSKQLQEQVAQGSATQIQMNAFRLYEDAAERARRVGILMAGEDIFGAHGAYTEAIGLLQEADATLNPPTPGDAGAAPMENPAPPPSKVAVSASEEPPPRNERVLPDEPSLRRLIRNTDLYIAALSVPLATFLGLSVLYANDTWGGLTDLVLAFLWGFGLYEVAGQSVHGYSGLRKKLTDP